MKVLFVTSEAAPIKKFGGLGDYSGSLPIALEKLGINVDVIMPYYTDAKIQGLKLYKSLELEVGFNNKSYTVEYHKTKLPKSTVDAILVKYKIDFSGDFLTDSEFFAFFDRAVVEYIKAEYNTYNLVHCNDWHTGFITHILEEEFALERPKTLLTIHNLGYQGVSSPELVREVGLLPGHHPLIDWDVSDGNVNMLLQGLASSDFLSTVSKSYAQEILTPEFGGEMINILTQRSDHLIGILNGIDYEMLPRTFDVSNWQRVKADFKTHLQQKLGLNKERRPIFAFISRLDVGQKGLDILLESVPDIIKNGGQFVLLGTGDKAFEEKFSQMGNDLQFKGNIAIKIEFDVNLANEIYSASDFFLVPSKYEPCGLTQMMAMWYGSLPVVHNVGGLKDTVKEGVNGFVFEKYLSKDLTGAVHRAIEVYHDDHKYEEMVENALKADFGWEVSAKEYKNLYKKILKS